MDKENSKQEVEKIVKSFQAVPQKKLDSMPEEDIKFQFIEPLLGALGWKREEISKEARILKGRADYLMKIGNQYKLVVEAKKTSINLDEKEGRQAVSYAHHKNIKFAVLTNFKQIRIYHALSNIKNIDKNLLKDSKGNLWLDCKDFIEQFDRLWLLSRESFEKEEINKLLENVDKRLIKPIDESILTDLLQYREWLSKDLKSKRNYLTEPQIDEVVQILIDRLIFMRSVEDRGLEEEDFLLKKINDVQQGRTDKNLWSLLLIQFKIFDKEYNSKLFSEGILEREGFFDERSLIKVIKGLYYGTQDHQERYRFDDLPVDLLGNIYEQYLGVVLRGTEKRVKLDLLSRKRKKMGIYYTPKYIVDYILDSTLVEYAKDKTLDEVLDIKVIDPACGSGSFLLDAFEELKKIIEERLINGEKSKSAQFGYFKDRLDLGQKSAILERCIYGVDLDEKAVELAQLNLLLKILEEETRETRRRILPNMKDNIKNGNSLISDSRFDKAFNWNAQFPDVFRQGGFDVVVGNPPYINNVKLSKKDKEFYSKNYQSAFEQYDILVLFLEKGYEILKNKGLLGFIVSNKFIISKYGLKIREFLLNKTKILELNDVSNIPVFKDASTYPIIITFSKDSGKNDIKIVKSSSETDFIKKNFNVTQINQDKFIKNKDYLFDINYSKSYNDLCEKLESNSIILEKLIDVRKGIETGGDKKFIFDDKKDALYKEMLVELIHSRDISRYNIQWSGKYLLYDIKKLKGPRKREIFERNKIVTCRTVKRLNFAYDDNGRYVTDTNQLLLPKSESPNILVILGIINSKLINYYYSKKFESSHMRGGYFRCFKQYLDKIPIKLPDEKQSKKIKELVERIIQFYKEGKPEQDIKNVDYEIDQEVYKLYGITKDEQKIIEESLG